MKHGLTLLIPALALACGDDGPTTDAAVDSGSDAAADSGAVDSSPGDAAPDAPAMDSTLPDGSTGDFTPYYHDDFESYAEGERPMRSFSRTTATADRAFRGSQSARIAIEPGDGGGFGQWGMHVPIEPAVPDGGEVWVRVYTNFPSSYEFSASPWMKFLRLHNQDGAGDNDGYNDLYIDEADTMMSVLRCIKEVHDVWEVYDGPAIPRDTWERYEMYLRVDDTPVDEGGEARMRIWRDDELIFDRTDVPTIETADGSIDLLYLFSYWNNEMPPSNFSYVDDLTIATDASPPPNRDAAGNVRIGDWPGS